MSFFALILKNLLRRKTRTFLTVLGISIGIATIIALGSIGEGLKKSMGDFLKVGGADFIVAQYGTAEKRLKIEVRKWLSRRICLTTIEI